MAGFGWAEWNKTGTTGQAGLCLLIALYIWRLLPHDQKSSGSRARINRQKHACANNWPIITLPVWVPEYAREYLLKHGAHYTYEDLLVIAQQQVALEDQLAATARQHSGYSQHPVVHRHRSLCNESVVRICIRKMPSMDT